MMIVDSPPLPIKTRGYVCGIITIIMINNTDVSMKLFNQICYFVVYFIKQ